jgi:murein DD-endopeptidase MepM/ murein hydrolase activator NlpD
MATIKTAIMRKLLALLCIITAFYCAGCGHTYRVISKGAAIVDTSYVYQLPFKQDTRKWLVQAYQSNLSHKDNYALDFKVRKGTIVCAARAGVVVAVRDDSNKRGMKPENMNDWNYVFIEHNDGTTAWYAHLKQHGALVKLGDTVALGQPIALSGNTGWSAFPHLHFEVHDTYSRDIPTRFITKKGVIYLRPGRFYKTMPLK